MDIASRTTMASPASFSEGHDFSKSIQSQNMVGRSAAAQKHPRDYGAVPVQQATARDAYVYAENADPFLPPNLMINPKRSEISGSPVVGLRNGLQDIHAQLVTEGGDFYLQDVTDNYIKAVDSLLTVRSNGGMYVHRTPDDAARSVVHQINTANDPLYQTFDHYSTTLRDNWNHVEGKPMDARRKGAPSLFTLATVQAIRGQSEGENLSAWRDDEQLGPVVDKAMRNVGYTGQQITRFAEFVNSEAFTQVQKDTVMAKLNDYFRFGVSGTPDLTLAELSASPDRLVQALAAEQMSFAGFMLGFTERFADNFPLKNYARTATVDDVHSNIRQLDTVNRIKALFATIPEEKSEAVVDDLAAAVEPLRQQFKRENPDY